MMLPRDMSTLFPFSRPTWLAFSVNFGTTGSVILRCPLDGILRYEIGVGEYVMFLRLREAWSIIA